jgi:hypothetical protein
MNADKRRYKKSGLGRPACLPAAAPTVHFSRILNLYIQWTSVSREFLKKDSGTSTGPVPELKGALHVRNL